MVSTTDKTTGPSAPATELTELEVGVIDLFVSALRMLGVPKSVGEIYGLLFISQEPLPLDSLVDRLKISKGSASQGLKVLRALGAVKAMYVGGDRRDHYTAETELKKLASGFIREELQPRIESGDVRLERLRKLGDGEAFDVAKDGFYRERIGKLFQWHARARSVLPLLAGMLE